MFPTLIGNARSRDDVNLLKEHLRVMKYQKQPSQWSCLPTAFATVIDLPITTMLSFIGHDGSEIIWPNKVEPFNRRSFHIQEIIDVLFDLKYMVTPFELNPSQSPFDEDTSYELTFRDGNQARFDRRLRGHRGVLIDITHATAWDGEKIIDPASKKMIPIEFWMVKPF